MSKQNKPKKPLKRRPSGGSGKKSAGQLFSYVATVILIFLVITSLGSFFFDESRESEDISISQLALDIKSGQVESILVEGSTLQATYRDETVKESKKELESSFSETLINYGLSAEDLSKVSIEVKSQSESGFWLLTILQILAPILFIVFFIWLLTRQVKGQSMQAFSFGQSKARVIDPNDKNQKVTFNDVAGVEEAKEELVEVVDFLRNPKKFLDIGARIPKGVLLMGAPGTGKTLLARAVAGEAKVPFLYLSGSEFVEMFVGVGASRVRDLFKTAKRIAPAIIFVDEIDAVGRHRGSGHGGGNDEREQTLNQILVEMDGFEPNEKIIVMAATNRPDVLDTALLRPGRFDRRVMLDLPDRKDRVAILNIHAQKSPLHDDVNLEVIAERTPGFSGADLANLMNEGAILAARESRKEITQYDLIRSIEKVMLGPERKSRVISKKEKKVTAYHEVGHALVSSVLEHADPVHKVTIIPRGSAGGYTLKLPLEERRYHFRKQFLDDIASTLGGYVAEKMIFGDLSTGPSNDLEVATNMARSMVNRYGMSDKIGPVAYGQDKNNQNQSWAGTKPYAESTATQLDEEVSKIMSEAEKRAIDVLSNHKNVLEDISEELMKVETLEREAFEKLLIKHGIEPKKAEEESKKN